MAIVTLRIQAPAISTVGNSARTAVGRSPVAGVVVRVSYFATTIITGAVTNNRTLSLFNGGNAGLGVVSVASKNFTNAVNAVAQSDTIITLSATPANLNIALSDILQWDSLAVGTGIADPGGTGEIDIQANLAS